MLKTRIILAGAAIYTVVLLMIPPAADAGTDAIASVQNVRYWATSDSTRIIIDLDTNARYENARLSNPDRIYFDISNAMLSRYYLNRATAVEDRFLKQVRVAQNRPDVVRVVLNVAAESDYIISELQDPFRIVIDLHGKPGTTTRSVFPPLPPNSITDEAERTTDSAAAPVAGSAAASRTQEALTPVQVNALDSSTHGSQPQQSLSMAETEEFPSEGSGLLPSSLSSDVVIMQSPGRSPVVQPNAKPPARTNERQAASSSDGERPLKINGTLVSGYYSAYTRGGVNGDQKVDFVPAGATFDINGYYLTPDLLDYSIQPELNESPQASDAGFQGGNGIRMRITSFRKQAFPITFRYSNVQLEDVYFGSLSQLSSYTLKNRDRELGVTAELRHSGLPTAIIDWGTSSVQSESMIQMIPDYNSRSDHKNVNLSYQFLGWDIRGFAGRQNQASDLFTPQSGSTDSSVLQQRTGQYRGSARRIFLQDSELSLDGGIQSTSNLILNRPIDMTTRYANANLRLFQRRRWKTSLRAGYTSNIAGLLLTRLTDGLSGNGSVAPDASVFQPFQRTVSYLNLNGLTSVDLSHGLGLYGSADRTEVMTANDGSLNSRYLTTTGGLTYAKTFGWGSLSGQYGRSFGMGAVIGQAGRVEGQTYVATIQPGKWDVLQLDFSMRGTDQRVVNEMPAREHSLGLEGNVGLRVFGPFRARLGGGWQQSTFANTGNDFHTEGYTGRIGIEHPRFQLDGALNSSAGNSLQAYGQLFSGIGVESRLFTPLQLLPSDVRGITVTLHINPMRKLEFTALWTRSIQHLEGIVTNDFEIIDVSATFHIRRLQFKAGFLGSMQSYASYLAAYPETRRGRYYIRISRTVKFL
jgi:hypothetical protein